MRGIKRGRAHASVYFKKITLTAGWRTDRILEGAGGRKSVEKLLKWVL